MIVVGLTIVPSSLVATSLAFDTGSGLAGAGEWPTLAIMFGKTVYGLLPYAMLALFLSVLTSSSSMGIAFSLAYYFVEGFLVAALIGLSDGFDSVSDLLLGPATAAWMAETGIEVTYQGTLFAPLLDLPSIMAWECSLPALSLAGLGSVPRLGLTMIRTYCVTLRYRADGGYRNWSRC